MNNNGFDPNLNGTYNNNTENAADTYAADSAGQTANDSSAASTYYSSGAEEQSNYGTPYSQSGTGQYGAGQSSGSYSYTPFGGYASTPQTPQYTGYSSTGGTPGGNRGGGKNHNAVTVILCVVLSLVLSTATSLFIVFGTKDNSTAAASSSSQSQTDSNDTASGNSQTVVSIDGNVESLVEAVYDKASPSVVGIRTTASVQSFFGGSETSTGEGSGIIYTADGYIITNYHVIEAIVSSSASSGNIEVYFPKDPSTPVDATVVGYNISADLAVIKVEKTGLTPIEVGNSDDIKVGQYAIAIGCPGGLQFMGSVSYGIISGLNRTITIDSIGKMELIQTDAAINPGNSGGALLNSNGQLIGINSSKLVNESYEGMGFAIPVNTALTVIKDIIENKDNPSPYIGIEVYTYNSAYLEKYGLPHGAAVKSVVTNGPAAQAQIRAGDIITEFGGVTIDEYTDFVTELNKCKPGAKVTAKIYRNGRYYSTTVTIGSNNSR